MRGCDVGGFEEVRKLKSLKVRKLPPLCPPAERLSRLLRSGGEGCPFRA